MTAYRLSERDEQRFFAKVGLPDDNGCMPWLASLDAYGYGQMSLRRNGRQRNGKAHRLMHELFNGPIAAGLDIDHRCGNRICVAPGHLRAVTRKQNMENLGGPYRTTVSGFRGVSRYGNRWIAKVQHDHRGHHLGIFDTVEEARLVVEAKRRELFTHNDREQAAS